MSHVYDFGGPLDYLVDIHFPTTGQPGEPPLPPEVSAPWFWYITQQTPSYFSFLGGVWGPGWVYKQILPVIKILPIDTQREVPTGPVGFGSIEEAIDRTNNGEPISQDAWGRFKFGNPKDVPFWWKVNGIKAPEYQVKAGVPTQPIDPRTGLPAGPIIADIFKHTVQGWCNRWNAGSATWTSAASGVSPGGGYAPVLPYNGGFAVPGPNPNETLPELARHLGVDQYYGPIPITSIFNTGNAQIFKQAFSFTMAVAQLDPTAWDMTTFPPKRTGGSLSSRGSGNPPFSESLKAGGYNPSIKAGIVPPFPQNPPIIVGASG